MQANTNLYMKLQILIHGKYMFKNVLGDPGNDSHSLGIMKLPLQQAERLTISVCVCTNIWIKDTFWRIRQRIEKGGEHKGFFNLKMARAVSQRELWKKTVASKGWDWEIKDDGCDGGGYTAVMAGRGGDKKNKRGEKRKLACLYACMFNHRVVLF